MGTDAADNCPATSAPNDEAVDAWPPDFNDSTGVTLQDVLLIKPHFNTASGLSSGVPYSPAQFLTADADGTQTTIASNGTAIATGDVIQIDSEQMKVTAGGGTATLTVVRGYNGTIPAAHASNGGANPILRVAYDRRFDLTGNGQITLQDVLLIKPFFNRTCTP